MRKKIKRESELQKQVMDWFKTRPDFLIVRTYVGPIIRGNGRKCPNPMAGFPDLFGFDPDNKAFAIELKRPDGKLQENQKEWAEKLRAKGVKHIIGRDLDQVIHELTELHWSDYADMVDETEGTEAI